MVFPPCWSLDPWSRLQLGDSIVIGHKSVPQFCGTSKHVDNATDVDNADIDHDAFAMHQVACLFGGLKLGLPGSTAAPRC